jgi:hypothetical protein
MCGFEIIISEERGAGIHRVTYPGVPIGVAGGTSGKGNCRRIFHKRIIHILLANIKRFFSLNKTGMVHRLHRLNRLPGLTQVIKIKEIRVICVISGLIKQKGGLT